jgi:hypothetical protein
MINFLKLVCDYEAAPHFFNIMKKVNLLISYLGKCGISVGILLDMGTRIITRCKTKALRLQYSVYFREYSVHTLHIFHPQLCLPCQVTVKGKFDPVKATNAYRRSRGIDALILNLGSRLG